MIENVPKQMTLCNLEVLLMPNGEVFCLGKFIGWFDNLKDYLTLQEGEISG
jgi:hypothetical protein